MVKADLPPQFTADPSGLAASFSTCSRGAGAPYKYKKLGSFLNCEHVETDIQLITLFVFRGSLFVCSFTDVGNKIGEFEELRQTFEFSGLFCKSEFWIPTRGLLAR